LPLPLPLRLSLSLLLLLPLLLRLSGLSFFAPHLKFPISNLRFAIPSLRAPHPLRFAQRVGGPSFNPAKHHFAATNLAVNAHSTEQIQSPPHDQPLSSNRGP